VKRHKEKSSSEDVLEFFSLNLSASSQHCRYLKRYAAWRGKCLRCQETPEWLFLHTASFPQGWKAGQSSKWLWGDTAMMAKENQQKANQPANLVPSKIQKYIHIPAGLSNSIVLLLRYSGKCPMSTGFWSLKAGNLYDFSIKRTGSILFPLRKLKFFTSHGDLKILTTHIALPNP